MKKAAHIVTKILLIIGALNWGLVGLFHYDIVAHVFGGMGWGRFIYDLIGLAGVYALVCLCRRCCGHSCCGKCGSSDGHDGSSDCHGGSCKKN